MDNKRIIYPNAEGGVCVVVPNSASDLTIDDVIKICVPKGVPYKIVDVSDIPSDRTFRNAWEYEQ